MERASLQRLMMYRYGRQVSQAGAARFLIGCIYRESEYFPINASSYCHLSNNKEHFSRPLERTLDLSFVRKCVQESAPAHVRQDLRPTSTVLRPWLFFVLRHFIWQQVLRRVAPNRHAPCYGDKIGRCLFPTSAKEMSEDDTPHDESESHFG